jgi:uncharacterized protein (TIGR03118 family)
MFSENSFVDHELPPLFVPFGVHAIGNDVVVTYVLHEPSSPLETDGPGLGFVDIYNSEGRLLQRLEHGDWLNAPWGVTLAPLDFGRFSHDLLIGQFAVPEPPSPAVSSLPTTLRPEIWTDCSKTRTESLW